MCVSEFHGKGHQHLAASAVDHRVRLAARR